MRKRKLTYDEKDSATVNEAAFEAFVHDPPGSVYIEGG